MKIVFSTYEAKEIGGSYLRSLSLAEGLSELGHEVTLWTSAKEISFFPKITYENKVKVIESIGFFPYRFRKGGYDIFDIIFRSVIILFTSARVFHSFNHRPVATVPFLFRKILRPRQTKWFLDWADLWGKGGISDRRYGKLSFLTKNTDHYLERIMIALPDVVTPISDDLVRKAQQIRKRKKNVFFLGVGANLSGITQIQKKDARQQLKLSPKNKILVYLYVGTYDEELLAQVFVELTKLRKDVKLILLGPKLEDFEKYLKNFPLASKKVIRAGVISRSLLSEYLCSGDVMMLPFAYKEINLGKFPNKLGDYLAAGRPISANPTGEVKKLFDQAQSTNTPIGILTPEDPTKFAQAIDDFLNDDKKLSMYGKNARRLAEEISWLSVAQKLESLYFK